MTTLQEAAQRALDALESNDKWHQDYDDHGIYPGSELHCVNTTAIVGMRDALANEAQAEPLKLAKNFLDAFDDENTLYERESLGVLAEDGEYFSAAVKTTEAAHAFRRSLSSAPLQQLADLERPPDPDMVDRALETDALKPAAWMCEYTEDGEVEREFNGQNQFSGGRKGVPLYTHPAPAEQPGAVGLSDEQIELLFCDAIGIDHDRLIMGTPETYKAGQWFKRGFRAALASTQPAAPPQPLGVTPAGSGSPLKPCGHAAIPNAEHAFAAVLGLPPGAVFADSFSSDARAVASNLMQACREDSMSDRTRILIGQAIGLILMKGQS